MANKFMQQFGTGAGAYSADVSVICEPKRHNAAPGFGTATNSPFKGEGPFQKAGTDTENVTLSGYKVNGTAVSAVEKGYCPTFNKCLYTKSTAGSVKLTRTDAKLSIGASTFKPKDFSCGIIPNELIFVIVGGGGGGGGGGYFLTSGNAKDKKYALSPGGAGGGGGVVVARINIKTNSDLTLTVGAGGAAGTHGSSGTNSRGTEGGSGGRSSVGSVAIATGAEGGMWGNQTCDEEGLPGAGGGGGSMSKDSTILGGASTIPSRAAAMRGGTGNSYGSHTRTSTTGLSFTSTNGTGATATQICRALENDDTGGQIGNSDDPSDLRYNGGCSHGSGDYWGNSGISTTNSVVGKAGGGGCAGKQTSAGHAGLIKVYY